MIIIKINYASTLPNVNITYDNSVIYAKVVYGNGGGGAATWGLINGTLSNQTDLQNALDAKVPYSGATDDVDLGEYGISSGFLQFDTTPTNTPATQGALYWDDSRETVSMIMDGTIQHIGQDSFFYVKNSTGSTIAKGTGVRFAGTDGASGHIRIDKFLANGTYPSTYFMGVTAESIGNGEFGQVMHFGELEGINTNAFSAGSLLYASTSVAGGFQTTIPSAPNNIVLVAATLNQKNNGAIVVRPTPGSNINTDEGVLISNPTNGQVLKYNSTSGLWENATDTVGTGTVTSVAVSGGTGISVSGSPITSSGTITVTNSAPDQVVSLTGAGTTTTSGTYPNFTITSNDQYVGTVTSVGLTSATSGVTIGSSPITTSGNISLTIATASGSQNGLLSSTDWTTFNNKQNALTNPITGTGVSGQVAYWNGTNTQTGSATFTFSPTAQLLLNNSVTATTAIARGANLTPTLTAAANNDVLVGLDINPTFTVGAFTGVKQYQINIAGNANINGVNQINLFRNGAGILSGLSTQTVLSSVSSTAPILFGLNTAALQVGQFSATTGNFILQNGGTFTDGGQRLQVTGTSYFSDSVGIGSTALTGFSFRVSKAITGSTASIAVRNDGTIQSDVTVLAYGFQTFIGTAAASFTLGILTHFTANQNTFGLGSTVTNQYGFAASNNLTGATNNYGFYGDIPSGTNRWNLFMNGTANNYMAGALGIGTTALTTQNFRISKTITGNNAFYNFRNDSTVQSDVTAFAIYNYTISSTAAASFTIADITHYNAAQGTFGAGSVVTSQTGFFVSSSLIGATNNFAFKGSIPSGTNRWNIHMDGTASNYLEGDTAIGTTALGTATKFTLGGSETAVSAIARGQLISTTLTASANNDVLVGLDINPTFTNGAFTGVQNVAIQIPSNGNIKANGFNGSYNINLNTNSSTINGGSGGINFQIFTGNQGRFFSTGNLLLQNGGTFTDAGFRLDVNGTARVQGNLSVTGGNALISNTRNLTIYNTADQTTNTETFRLSYDLNVANIISAKTGTGTTRPMNIEVLTFGYVYLDNAGSSDGFIRMGRRAGSGINDVAFINLLHSTSFGHSSGLGKGVVISGNINQSGTGSYTSLLITPREVTTGSGAKLLINAGTNSADNGTGTHTSLFTVSSSGLMSVGQSSATAYVDISASTTANASLRIRSGVAPTAPNDGDIWFDGTDIKMRIGGVTKTFTLT
jgi:hypothetical protein